MNYDLNSLIHNYELSIKIFKDCKAEWRGKSKTIERQVATLNYLRELRELKEKIDNPTTQTIVADTHNDPAVINRYKKLLNRRYGYSQYDHKIKKVIHNGPATIIFWDDNTKTIVKNYASPEYDKEKGILYAAVKKFATKKEYNDILRTIDKEKCGKDDDNDDH